MTEGQNVQTEVSQKTTQEKQTNCLGCGKPLKKIKRYYRNGKYYCTKKCWRKTKKTKTEETKA